MRSEEEVNRAIDLYADTVYRICMLHLKNPSDTEDIFQEVFLKYALSATAFENAEHEKAWVIRVTLNQCKDLLKSFFHSRTVPLEEAALVGSETQEHSDVLDAVTSLPRKYKDVIYLHDYEGYSALEISQMLKMNVNTVYTSLNRGRKLLREKLGGDSNGE